MLNGWSNEDTYAAALIVLNDEYLYSFVRRNREKLLREAFTEFMAEYPGNEAHPIDLDEVNFAEIIESDE